MKRKRCDSAAWGRSLVFCAVVLSASVAFAGSRISKDLEGKQPSDQVNVIVQFKHALTTKSHETVRNRGGKLNHELELLKGGSYSVPASALADLAADPEVAYVSPDRIVQGTVDSSQTLDY